MRRKKWVKPYLDSDTKYLIDKYSNTGNNKVYLEIGMGHGDFICASAKLNPDITYIGLEKDETCTARAIMKAKELDINNLYIMRNNAELLEELFSPNSVDCIYLHFSDPWPKKGHHKRRLTYPTFLERYKHILKDNGEIIYKTDNKDFFMDSLTYFDEANMKVIDISYDYHSIVRNEPLTGYEQKFKDLGYPIYYAKVVRNSL